MAKNDSTVGRNKSATPATSRKFSTKPKSLSPAAAAAPKPQKIPQPPADLASRVTRKTWTADTPIHRIHLEKFRADEFNPGFGNARFSPIADASGKSIPTVYGGTTFDCAAMETVFHSTPDVPGLKTVAKRKLKGHQHSQLLPSSDLTLADLSSIPLRKLGVQRSELIDSEADVYPQTRLWAAAVHEQCPDVQGLEWVSKQDDKASAIILFEDRLPPSPLRSVAPSVDIVEDAATYGALIDLAGRIGVQITGK